MNILVNINTTLFCMVIIRYYNYELDNRKVTWQQLG